MSAPRFPLPFLALCFTQIVGWGTTYYLPASLTGSFVDDLGLDRTTVYLGVTAMLVASGLVSPIVGRRFDRSGAARFLPIGTVLMVIGLCGLLTRPGPAGWFAVWTLFGIAQAIGLTLAVQTYLARVDREKARRNIGLLLLATGLSSSIFWPVTAALDALVGWWWTIVVFAVLQTVVVLPLHLWIAGRHGDGLDETAARRHEGPAAVAATADERVPTARRRAAEVVMVIAFATQGFASWGLPLHIIDLFRDLGLDRGTAVAIAAANGPAVLAARLIEVGWGARWRPLDVTLFGMAILIPTAAAALAPVSAAVAAFVLALGWSAANGLLGVLKVTVPLTLFGADGFGTLAGRIALPINLVLAVSPTAFAAIIERFGPTGGAATAVGCAMVATVATMGLTAIVRRPAR